MKHDSSIPHLQVPATCLYPETDQSSPWSPSHFLKIHLNIILLSTRGSSKWFLFLRFPTKALYTLLLSLIHATCPAHLILLELITRTIHVFAEECRSLSSSLCSYEKSILPSPEIKSWMSFV